MRASARVVVALRDDGVLGLAVLVRVRVRVRALVLALLAPEADDGLRVAQVAVLLLARVARVHVPLEVLRVAHRAAVVLLVRQRPERAVVEVVRRRAVVERQRLVPVAPDVGEAVRGQRAAPTPAPDTAPAASRALRPARALRAGHEEHARRGVKL